MGITDIWQVGVVDNLATGLTFLYTTLGGFGITSWGLTIIIFTVIVKMILMPLTVKQLKSARSMQTIQPALREIQKKYGKDRERFAAEQMKLYKEHGVNPAMGCLPMLVQMPIWIGLYGALLTLAGAGALSGGFLWIPSLALPEGAPYIMGILTGATQWVVQKMAMPVVQDPQQKQMNMMMQFMPLMFIFFAFQVSSGLVLYWITSNIVAMIQQYFITGWGSLGPMLPWVAKEPAAQGKKLVAQLPNGTDSGNGKDLLQTESSDQDKPQANKPAPRRTTAAAKRRRARR